jgi:hypothetical protein
METGCCFGWRMAHLLRFGRADRRGKGRCASQLWPSGELSRHCNPSMVDNAMQAGPGRKSISVWMTCVPGEARDFCLGIGENLINFRR